MSATRARALRSSLPFTWSDDDLRISVEIRPEVLRTAEHTDTTLALFGTFVDGDPRLWHAVDCEPLSEAAAQRADLIGIATRGGPDPELSSCVPPLLRPILLVSVHAGRTHLGLWAPGTRKQVYLSEVPLHPQDPQPAAGSGRVLVRFDVPRWVWAAALFLAAAAISAHYYTRFRATADTQPPAVHRERVAFGFGMQASRVGNGVQIRWDSTTPALRNAGSAVLKVKDGTDIIALPLTSTELASGQVTYVPKTQALDLELSVAAGGTPVSERVRVLLTEPKPPAAQPRSVQPLLVTPQARTAVSLPVVPPPTAKPAGEERPSDRAESFTPSPPAQQSPPASQLAPVPALAPVVIASSQTPAQPIPALRNPVQIPPPKTVAFVAPVPLRQETPVVPETLRRIIISKMSVEVNVRIGPDGSVVSVQTPAYIGLMGHLAQLSGEAARRWKFRPATRDGEPVESQYVIHFNFDRRR